MTITTKEGSAIQTGYPFRQRVTLRGVGGAPAPSLFPSGCALRAQVRSSRTSAPLADLTTANGGIVRVSDTEIDIVISGAATALFPVGGRAFLDLVRTDLSPPEHLQIGLGFAVMQPITRAV